jgi:SAM-dependent methyltransferase
MATTQDHYDRHLGPVYSWMTGDFDALCRRNAELFDRLGLEPVEASVAVDLGAGHGAQAVPLARRGYHVVAVDFCRALLDELQANAAELPVIPVEADLLDFGRHISGSVDAVVCMGDTLPHLQSLADIETLVGRVAEALAAGGLFVATFRDYVSREAEGEARFIPVKATEDRILTCFLEYSPDAVTVYDLLHRKDDGRWVQEVSSYRKLRLDPEQLAHSCAAAGLDIVEQSTSAGMVTLAARKPAA